MSKKRAKSGVASAGPAKWESALQSANLTDAAWKAHVYFIHENQVQDRQHIESLAHGIAQGTRRLFTFFSKDELYNDVKVLGNPKTKKAKETPANYEICELCKTHLDAEEDIPIHLLVKLLKWKFLWIKANDLKRRDVEKKAALEKQKGGGGGGKKDKSGGKSAKGKGGKKTPEPPSPKKDSKLIKRGEEDLDSKYIDDEPNNGPSHYIFIYGFHLPYIYQLLDEQDIQVESVIRIASQDYAKPKQKDVDEEGGEEPVVDEEAEQKLQDEKDELQKFWKDFQVIIENVPSTSNVHDLARLDYIVENLILPDDVNDHDKKLEFCATLYEDVARLCYNLIDTKRQYNNYLANMKLIPIPAATPSIGLASTDASVDQVSDLPKLDMRYYNDLMNTIPQESVSVELVMMCMLEQMDANENDKTPPTEVLKPLGADGVDPKIAGYLESLAASLALSEEEIQALNPEIAFKYETEEPINGPKLLSPHDDISIRVDHLKEHCGLNAIRAEQEMLRYIPFAGMNSFARPSSSLAKERSARLQELLHFCSTSGLAQSEIDKALKQFVFESIDITIADPNGYILSTESEGAHHSVIPWDDPYPFFKGLLPKTTESDNSDLNLESGVRSSVSIARSRDGAKTPTPEDEEKEVREGSRSATPAEIPGTPGILRSSSHLSHNASVHFGTDQHGVDIQPITTSPEPEKSIEDSMDEIIDAQKRNLDQWCFAEHYEPNVLLQILRKAMYNLPFYDTYYHKRDHSLMVVLHNPQSPDMQNCTFWENNLHSGVGFRNYIEHVGESIDSWTRGEEAKYEASLLRNEVNKMEEEMKSASRAASPDKNDKKRDRSSSPKKSSRGRSTSRSASQDRSEVSISENFVRADSLKMQKVEMEKIKAEEEEKERLKSEKRARSAQKRANKEASSAEKDKKRPGSKSSKSGSRKSSPAATVRDIETEIHEPVKEPEPYWPFVGYDLGYELIHVSGAQSCLFPADGGVIRTERIDFILGSTIVKTTVVKDGNTFSLHILEPQVDQEDEDPDFTIQEPTPEGKTNDKPEIVDKCEVVGKTQGEEKEKAETEESEKEKPEEENPLDTELEPEITEEKPKSSISKFGSFSATMRDGLVISYSSFGDSGSPERKEEEIEPVPVPVSITTRSPTPGKESPSKTKRDKSSEKATSSPEPPGEEEKTEEKHIYRRPFQKLYLTSPDGLHVQLLSERDCGGPPNSDSLVVRQSYPQKTANLQECEALRRAPAMDEASRIVTKEGIVIKTMCDGNVQVLFADGTVSSMSSPPSPAPVVVASSSPIGVGLTSAKQRDDSPSKKSAKRKGSAKDDEPAPEEKKPDGLWQTTLSNGQRISTNMDGVTEVPTKNALICIAHDPSTQEEMYTRDDRVVMVHKPDGTTLVEHSDGTRITRYMNETEIKSSEADGGNDDVRIIILENIVRVECPGFASVEFNEQSGHCDVRIGASTIIHAYPEASYIIDFWDGGRLNIDFDGAAAYFPRPNNDIIYSEANQELTYFMRHDSEVLVETLDNEGNLFTVKASGDIAVNRKTDDDISSVSEDDLICKPAEKKIQMYKQHAPRFFFIHSDGSGTELLRYQDIAEYLTTAESDPLTAVLVDSLVDFPNVTGINILRPAERGLSDRWLKGYDEQSIVPDGLRTRDLKSFPAKENKTEGVKFGTKLGKGLAIGSAIIPLPTPEGPRCPHVLEHRQLVQFKPVNDEVRETMYDCLKDYALFVKVRKDDSEDMQAHDPRSEEELMHAADLVLQSMPTKADDLGETVVGAYEQATTPPNPTPPPTPRPKRSQTHWERDHRELQEEADIKIAMRNTRVPPYFESEMGKSFLLTQAPDMNALMQELAQDTRQGEDAAVRSRTGTPNSPQVHYISGNTPSKLRPGNPTPAHATGTGSPPSVRPTAPTPAHATKMEERPVNPTPKQSGLYEQKVMSDNTPTNPCIQEKIPEGENENECPRSQKCKALYEDVTGDKRKQPVFVPAYLNASRPDMCKNDKFLSIEESARRKVHTSSVAGATCKAKVILENSRGFELLPDHVDFGTLREGYTYRFSVYLKNTGVDSCRFKLQQPPPATGMNIVYKPGPIAAGMKATLQVEVYAIANGVEGNSGVGGLEHDLKIITETDHLTLPITASVLTADDFDNRSLNRSCQPHPGVELVTRTSRGTQGIIRPRKDVQKMNDELDAGLTA